MKFYIVNDIDNPYPPLVAYETFSGKLNYLDRSNDSYDGMGKNEATPLEESAKGKATKYLQDQSLKYKTQRRRESIK